MKIRLETSGGFANLHIEGELDTDQLPADLAERIERGLRSPTLRDAVTVENPELADGTVYELTILPEGEDGERQFVFDDAAVAEEILDVLDAILHEIIRRRRDALREHGGDG